MISVKLVGDRQVAARFSAMPSRLHALLKRAITKASFRVEARTKAKLSGQVLNVRTGALRASIFSETKDTETEIVGRVASSGDVRYAGIHEFGGVIHHPGGTAYTMVAGEGVKFISNAAAATAHILGRTRAHDIVMPERSFLRSSLRDETPSIQADIRQAVADVKKD